jgi:hypothetical protein
MKLNSKVTGGLAWAGLVLVLAVPSADMLTKPSANSATITSDMDAVETASITPAVQAAAPAAVKPVVPVVKPVVPATRQVAAGNNVVEDFISSGKKLPSYISDAPAATAQQPAAVKPVTAPSVPATAAVKPDGTFADQAEAKLASVQPAMQVTAPVPYPASKRPKPTAVATAASASEAPLIIDDEDVLVQREATLLPLEPIPPSGSPSIVTQDQLEEWDSGSLADYLERKGLISDAVERLDSQFDEDGFFLRDGPNNSTVRRRRDNDDVDFFLF